MKSDYGVQSFQKYGCTLRARIKLKSVPGRRCSTTQADLTYRGNYGLIITPGVDLIVMAALYVIINGFNNEAPGTGP